MENNKNINNENEIDFDYGWEQQKEPDRLDEINVVRAAKAKEIMDKKAEEDAKGFKMGLLISFLYYAFPIILMIVIVVVGFLTKVLDFAKDYFF